MAMGGKSQDAARRAFSSHHRYSNSTGNLTGTHGAPRNLGWLGSRADFKQLAASSRKAAYTVYSYDTPIGWAIEDEETGMFERVIPEEQHSSTTSHHQSLLRSAWADSYHDGTPEGRDGWLTDNTVRNLKAARAEKS